MTAKIISTSSGLRIQNPVLQDVKISLFIRPPTVLEAETHFRLRQNGTLLQVPNELVNVEEEGLYSIKNIPNYFIFNQPHFSSIYTKGKNLDFRFQLLTGSSVFFRKMVTFFQKMRRIRLQKENCYQYQALLIRNFRRPKIALFKK